MHDTEIDKITSERCKYNKYKFNNKAKQIVMHNKFTGMAYDGKTLYKMGNNEYYSYYKSHSTTNLIQHDYTCKLTLEEEYDLFIHDAEILIKETNGVINLYKSGDTNTTILNLFDKYTKHIPNADHIGQVEADWISESSTGALTFGIPYVGPVHKYDFKSNYPSIMKSSQTFAIKEGEFQLISDKEFRESDAYFKYGIFRCVVKRSGDYSIDKLFRFNHINKYTHIDLNNALTKIQTLLYAANYGTTLMLRQVARALWKGYHKLTAIDRLSITYYTRKKRRFLEY